MITLWYHNHCLNVYGLCEVEMWNWIMVMPSTESTTNRDTMREITWEKLKIFAIILNITELREFCHTCEVKTKKKKV